MEIEELLKMIGGRKEKSFIKPEVSGVYLTWSLEDIKKDGVSYNLFQKKDTNNEYYWQVSKITVSDNTMEFDSFSADEHMFYNWLISEFIEFVREDTINKILN